MGKKVLIISPHMDDEVLGVGGTICRHVQNGDHVTVIIVANRAYNHKYDRASIESEMAASKAAQLILGYQKLLFLDLPDEQLDHKVIELITPIEENVKAIKPDIVYIPHRGDNNQDHRAVFEAVRVVLRPFSNFAPEMIRSYEVPSSTDISPGVSEWPFIPTCYINISDWLDKKIEAMNCYDKESRSFPHPRSPEAIKAFSMKRGSEISLNAAEAFMIIREIYK